MPFRSALFLRRLMWDTGAVSATVPLFFLEIDMQATVGPKPEKRKGGRPPNPGGPSRVVRCGASAYEALARAAKSRSLTIPDYLDRIVPLAVDADLASGATD